MSEEYEKTAILQDIDCNFARACDLSVKVRHKLQRWIDQSLGHADPNAHKWAEAFARIAGVETLTCHNNTTKNSHKQQSRNERASSSKNALGESTNTDQQSHIEEDGGNNENEDKDLQLDSPEIQLRSTKLLTSLDEEDQKEPQLQGGSEATGQYCNTDGDDFLSSPNLNLKTKAHLVGSGKQNKELDADISPIRYIPDEGENTIPEDGHLHSQSSRAQGQQQSSNKSEVPNTPGNDSVHSSDFELSTGKHQKASSRRRKQRADEDAVDSPSIESPDTSRCLSRFSLDYLESTGYHENDSQGQDHTTTTHGDNSVASKTAGKKSSGLNESNTCESTGELRKRMAEDQDDEVGTPIKKPKYDELDPESDDDFFQSNEELPVPDFDLSLFPKVFQSGKAAHQLVAVWSQFAASEPLGGDAFTGETEEPECLDMEELKKRVSDVSEGKMRILLDTLVSVGLLRCIRCRTSTFNDNNSSSSSKNHSGDDNDGDGIHMYWKRRTSSSSSGS